MKNTSDRHDQTAHLFCAGDNYTEILKYLTFISVPTLIIVKYLYVYKCGPNCKTLSREASYPFQLKHHILFFSGVYCIHTNSKYGKTLVTLLSGWYEKRVLPADKLGNVPLVPHNTVVTSLYSCWGVIQPYHFLYIMWCHVWCYPI